MYLFSIVQRHGEHFGCFFLHDKSTFFLNNASLSLIEDFIYFLNASVLTFYLFLNYLPLCIRQKKCVSANILGGKGEGGEGNSVDRSAKSLFLFNLDSGLLN